AVAYHLGQLALDLRPLPVAGLERLRLLERPRLLQQALLAVDGDRPPLGRIASALLLERALATVCTGKLEGPYRAVLPAVDLLRQLAGGTAAGLGLKVDRKSRLGIEPVAVGHRRGR